MSKLTIIIPVYNEIKTIEKLLNKIISLNIKKQIIVVDDGSRDGTVDFKKFNKKIDKLIFHKENYGKGAAIKSAQKYVNGKFVGIQDADLEYNPNDLIKIVSAMERKNIRLCTVQEFLIKACLKTLKTLHIIRIWGISFNKNI